MPSPCTSDLVVTDEHGNKLILAYARGDTPELNGPYTTDNGVCSNGHPLNGYGRCEPLNTPEETVNG